MEWKLLDQEVVAAKGQGHAALLLGEPLPASYEVRPKRASAADAAADIVSFVASNYPGGESGIVYCLTRCVLAGLLDCWIAATAAAFAAAVPCVLLLLVWYSSPCGVSMCCLMQPRP
jgi:hypothetical protein